VQDPRVRNMPAWRWSQRGALEDIQRLTRRGAGHRRRCDEPHRDHIQSDRRATRRARGKLVGAVARLIFACRRRFSGPPAPTTQLARSRWMRRIRRCTSASSVCVEAPARVLRPGMCPYTCSMPSPRCATSSSLSGSPASPSAAPAAASAWRSARPTPSSSAPHGCGEGANLRGAHYNQSKNAPEHHVRLPSLEAVYTQMSAELEAAFRPG
jgi:hypothetical protein